MYLINSAIPFIHVLSDMYCIALTTIHCGFVFVFSISEFILNLVIKFMNEYAVVAVKVRYIFVKALLWFCVFGVFHGLKTPLLVTKGNVGTSYPIIICRWLNTSISQLIGYHNVQICHRSSMCELNRTAMSGSASMF